MKILDSIDKRILSILQVDGRITNVDLASRVHLSPTPCLDRVRRLERDQYILGYRAQLNPTLLNCDFVILMAVILNRTTEDVFDKFARHVKQFDEISECHMVGGGFDYLLKIRTASMADFRAFMGDKISTLPEVAQTHSYFVMEEVKDSKVLVVR